MPLALSHLCHALEEERIDSWRCCALWQLCLRQQLWGSWHAHLHVLLVGHQHGHGQGHVWPQMSRILLRGWCQAARPSSHVHLWSGLVHHGHMGVAAMNPCMRGNISMLYSHADILLGQRSSWFMQQSCCNRVTACNMVLLRNHARKGFFLDCAFESLAEE